MYRIAYALVRLLAPILSFTTEEVWGYFCKAGRQPGQRSSGAVAGTGRVDRGPHRRSNANACKLGPA